MAERTNVTAPDADQFVEDTIGVSADGADIEDFNTEDNAAARELAITIAQAADDRKAENIRILDVSGISYLADYFVIASGFSKVQVRAIARSVEAAVKEAYERHPVPTEGLGEGQWVLYDYGEVIVHIFMPREREFYDLEAFWGHAQEIPFVPNLEPLSVGSAGANRKEQLQ